MRTEIVMIGPWGAGKSTLARLIAAKLGRKLTAKEKQFVTSRRGFVALEMILDTVRAGSPVEIEAYLNSE